MTANPPTTIPAIETGKFHIPSLDGFRALAFLIVFLSHMGLQDVIPGKFGVTIFFFLSGYLITTLMRIEFDSSADISLKNFYLRRTLRILPPFYTVLALDVLLTMTGTLSGGVTAAGTSALAFHVGNYRIIYYGGAGIPLGSRVFWSLAVEEHFYLLFPLFYLFLRRRVSSRGRQALILLAICGTALLWRCVLVHAFHASRDRLEMGSDTRMDSILFGCILAVWGNPMLDAPRVSELGLKRLWTPVAVAALLFCFIIRTPAFRETFRYSIQGLAFIPLFTAAIRFPRWGGFHIFNLAFVRTVGVLSYSLYLLHSIVIYLLERAMPLGLACGILAMGISLLLAYLIFRFIEKPCARLRRRLAISPVR